MAICPVCNHENAFGALVCTKCYALLVNTSADTSTTTLDRDTLTALDQALPSPHRTARLPGSLAPGEVAFYISGVKDPLIFKIGRQAVLGRQAADSSSQPRIDLSPYEAFQKGVSRMHAIIRRDEKLGMVVEDLASSNGTWLNGTRLQPYIPRVLHSGDVLKLSQIEITVAFGENARLGGG